MTAHFRMEPLIIQEGPYALILPLQLAKNGQVKWGGSLFEQPAQRLMKPIVWLVLALVAFGLGFTEQENIVSYLGRPMGAIFFGIYLIDLFFRKEIDRYDQEQQKKSDAAGLGHLQEKEEERPAGRPVPHGT